jgi:hypothetical protein
MRDGVAIDSNTRTSDIYLVTSSPYERFMMATPVGALLGRLDGIDDRLTSWETA